MSPNFFIVLFQHQINFLSVANVVFHCYHFSKQFLSNLSKIIYLAFFITFCFVVSLAKMVTLTNNTVYKKSTQYRKYILKIYKRYQLVCEWRSLNDVTITSSTKHKTLISTRSFEWQWQKIIIQHYFHCVSTNWSLF